MYKLQAEEKLKKLGVEVEKEVRNGYIVATFKTKDGKKLSSGLYTVESFEKYVNGLLDGYKLATTKGGSQNGTS